MAVDGQGWLVLGGLSLVAVAVWLVIVGGAHMERRGAYRWSHRSDQTNT